MQVYETWRTVLFGIGLVAATSVALSSTQASETCKDALEGLSKDWAAIAVPGPGASADADRSGQEEHRHKAIEVEYMRSQLRLAARQCDEGNHHEALLRMDVVRAWLKLPEVQHPSDHQYTPPSR